jgi:hypothetical protein
VGYTVSGFIEIWNISGDLICVSRRSLGLKFIIILADWPKTESLNTFIDQSGPKFFITPINYLYTLKPSTVILLDLMVDGKETEMEKTCCGI